MSSRANETALFSDVSLLSTLNLRASPFVGRAFERSGKFRSKQMLEGNHFREWIEFHKNTVKFCCTRLHSSRNSYFLLYANNFIKWSCTLHNLLVGILLLLLQRQWFPIYSCYNSKFKVALRIFCDNADRRELFSNNIMIQANSGLNFSFLKDISPNPNNGFCGSLWCLPQPTFSLGHFVEIKAPGNLKRTAVDQSSK